MRDVIAALWRLFVRGYREGWTYDEARQRSEQALEHGAVDLERRRRLRKEERRNAE